MIRRDVLRSLRQEEMDMLLYVTNILHPPIPNMQVDENILVYYKIDAVTQICNHYRDRVRPEFVSIYDDMIAKINGTYKKVTNDDSPEPPQLDQYDHLDSP